MALNNLLGAWGEQLAVDYLKKHGYKILSCNYITRFGEIDIIARFKKVLVFVEVKLRKSDRFGTAREYVGYQKQNRIRSSAQMWLSENSTELQPRFDVIEIYAPDGLKTSCPEIIHLEDAFQ